MTPPAAAVAQPLPRRRHSTRTAPVRHPRRISGPVRPARPAAPARQPRARQQAQTPGLAPRVFAAYERVADSALLDRLARGRLWIGLLAFGLIGIVAMQLMVLRLNTNIGVALQRAAGLQRSNAQLRIEAATGAGEGRIEPLAAATGMTFAASGSVHFVTSSPAADIARAASVLSQPIQPHEAAPASSEAVPASAEGEASSAASSGEGEGEAAAASQAASSEESTSSSATSEPVTTSSESSSSQAASTTTSEPEASAAAAGGVAAGH